MTAWESNNVALLVHKNRPSLAPSLASLYPCDMSNVSLVGDNNVGAAG